MNDFQLITHDASLDNSITIDNLNPYENYKFQVNITSAASLKYIYNWNNANIDYIENKSSNI